MNGDESCRDGGRIGRIIDEGGGERTLGGDDGGGSEEEKGGELRPHRSAGREEVVGSAKKRHVLGREAAAKTRNRRWHEDVKVIPTDGMFAETEFSRPSLPDIPAKKK